MDFVDENGKVETRFQVPRTVAERFGYTITGEKERGQKQSEEVVEEEAEEEEQEKRLAEQNEDTRDARSDNEGEEEKLTGLFDRLVFS